MGELRTAIEAFFLDAQGTVQIIAPFFAFLGLAGLALMYMGASWPIIGDWKKDNPKAASQVVMGLVIMLSVSTLSGMVSFA